MLEYGNLAYKIEVEEKQEKKVIKEQKLPPVRICVKIVIYAILISLAAYYMISKQIAVYETEREIKNLQSQIEDLKSKEVLKNFELEQSVDLGTVEEIATTKLNMQRPEHNQRVYVNITGEDVTEITAEETEGVKSKMSDTANDVKKNILGIFSVGW